MMSYLIPSAIYIVIAIAAILGLNYPNVATGTLWIKWKPRNCWIIL